MMLKALCDYYIRAGRAPGAEPVAEPGYQALGAGAQIVLDKDGSVVAISSLKRTEGKKQVPRTLIVPQPPKRSGKQPEPAFLYENAAFLFGIYEKPEGAEYRFAASARIHRQVLEGIDDEGAVAVLRFFERRVPGGADYLNVDISAIADPRTFCVFSLKGDSDFIHDRPAVRAAWERHLARLTEGALVGQCLITGELAPLARLHGNVSGFGGDKPTLIGFNQPAFEFFGKEQGANAPVGERAAFQYVTALNMLCQDRRHHVNLTGDKLIFWAERDALLEEDTLRSLFGGDIEDDEPALDPAQRDRVKAVVECAIRGGNPAEQPIDPGVNFYVIGLAANKTRLVVRFFYRNTFGNLLERMAKHYGDLEVAGMRHRYPTPYRILLETAVQRKRENVMPTIEGALMRSILQGTPYPEALYQAVLRRIRAEAAEGGSVTALRAGILKAYLNRKAGREEIKVALDKKETDVAYLLGRLFAYYEKAQRDAIENLNSSISDKYFNAALSTPQMVFPTLDQLSRKHLSKTNNFWLGGQIREVVNLLGLQADAQGKYAFPPSLDANSQGKFILGYYHQVEDLYTKKSAPAAGALANVEGGSNYVAE